MRFEKNAAGEWIGIHAMRGAKPVPANEAELPLWKRFMGMYEHDLQRCEKCASTASIIKSQATGQIIIKCVSCGASIFRTSINGKVQYFTIGWGQGPVVVNAQDQAPPQVQNDIGDVVFALPYAGGPQIQWQRPPEQPGVDVALRLRQLQQQDRQIAEIIGRNRARVIRQER